MKLSHWGRVMGPVGLVLLAASILTILVAGDTGLGLINIALGIVCVAFYLVTNVRDLAEKATGRGAFYGVTSAVTSALLIAGLVGANYLAITYPKTWDVTAAKIHSFSDDTTKTVSGLKDPVELVAFFKTGEPQADAWSDLAQRYHQLSEKFTYKVVDPEKEPQLVKEANLTRGGPHVVLKQGKTDVKLNAPTEEELTNAIVKVTHQSQKKVYFLDGHGESKLDDREVSGFKDLVDRMENEGLKAESLPFGRGEIPTDAAAVVIAGPQKPLLPAEVAVLHKFLDEGGRVFALLEPLTPTGLEPLLSDYGIAIDPGVVVDQAGRSRFESPFAAVGVGYGQHPSVKNFNLVTIFPQAASLSVAAATGVSATPLVFTLGPVQGAPVTWVEASVEQVGEGPTPAAKPGPLNIAIAASKPVPKDAAGKRSEETRLIVVGDHDFAANGNFNVLGNADFALNCLNYLVDQGERISIRPRQREASRLFLTAAQMGGIRFFATELPIGLLAFGLAIFFNRRAK